VSSLVVREVPGKIMVLRGVPAMIAFGAEESSEHRRTTSVDVQIVDIRNSEGVKDRVGLSPKRCPPA